jgi:hypothetical protein
VATVKRLLEKTCTATGLGVVVEVLDKVYQTGRTYTEGFKEDMNGTERQKRASRERLKSAGQKAALPACFRSFSWPRCFSSCLGWFKDGSID